MDEYGDLTFDNGNLYFGKQIIPKKYSIWLYYTSFKIKNYTSNGYQLPKIYRPSYVQLIFENSCLTFEDLKNIAANVSIGSLYLNFSPVQYASNNELVHPEILSREITGNLWADGYGPFGYF